MVDRFADAYPRFDELGKEIENGLINGLDLKQAYHVAVALDRFKRSADPIAIADALKRLARKPRKRK